MCLAVPAKVVERDGDVGWVELGPTRVRVSLLMTPEASVGDWVLVHAGFALQSVDEQEARETWDLLESVDPGLETVHPDSIEEA